MKIKLLSIAIALLFAASSQAQYRVLHDFNNTLGALPASSLTLSGQVLYGAAEEGGLYGYGCIFSIDTNGSKYKDIFDFDNTNGYQPIWSLTLLGHTLFGMALGGANGWGCIYSIDTNGGGYKDIFDFNFANGADPEGFGSFAFSGKVLYGMTYQGGAHSDGVIFSIDTNGNNYKDLLDFNNAPSGDIPNDGLILSGNKLYGMARGGLHNKGCVFSIDTNGSSYKDIFDFNDTDGNDPNSSLILSRGHLYGMTFFGGTYDSGVVFTIDTSGSGFKVLHDFNGLNGNYPIGSLTLSGSILYGTTLYGGATYDSGSIFSIDTDGSNFTELYNFNGLTGSYTDSPLQLSGNILYGMTNQGGTDSVGVVFSFKVNNIATSTINLCGNSGAVNVFPNPNAGVFTISLQNVLVKAEIVIYNTIGEKVFEAALNPGLTQMNFNNQPAGLYLYRVITEQGQLISDGKVILEK